MVNDPILRRALDFTISERRNHQNTANQKLSKKLSDVLKRYQKYIQEEQTSWINQMKEVDGFFGQTELDSLRDGAHSQCEK